MNSSENTTFWFLDNQVSMYFKGAVVAVQVLWIFFISFSNGLTIYCIFKYKLWKKSYNVFTVGLAVTDFLVGAVVIPTDIWRKVVVRVLWTDSGTPSGLDSTMSGCMFLIFVNVIPVICSYVFVMLISLDRFVSIAFPLFHHTASSPERNTLYVIGGCLLCTSVLGASCLIPVITDTPYNPFTENCTYNLVPRTMRLILSMVFGVLTLFVSYVCHGYVAYKACRSRNVVHPVNTAVLNKIKIAKGTFLILGTFTACMMPTAVFKALPITQNYTPTIQYFDYVFVNITYVNSAFNPLLYTYSYPEIRKSVNMALRIIFRRHATTTVYSH